MKPDIKADIVGESRPLRDGGEHLDKMEPMRIGEDSRHRPRLLELCAEVMAKAGGFRGAVPDGMVAPLSDLTRAMNCYYSNRMEGSPTSPVEIDRALHALPGNLESGERSDWEQEALAHIEVQRWLDGGALTGAAATIEGLREIHRRFCAALPASFLNVENSDTGEVKRVAPGEFRRHGVQVGRHIAPSPGSVPRFMARFQEGCAGMGKLDSLLNAAAAHHRLAWIHPFLDGNGRVARLMSHAVLRDALDSGGIWSVTRGLGRDEWKYKILLGDCDLPRRNDCDGRGNLSEEALVKFTEFFLGACLDQIAFMERSVHPERLPRRGAEWARGEISRGDLPRGADALLEELLRLGELPRGKAEKILSVTDRQARRVMSALTERGVAAAKSSRAPLHPAFPLVIASEWMPGIFPE